MPTAVLDEIRDLTERRHRDPATVLRRVEELMAGVDDPRVDAEGSLAAGLALQEVGRIPEAVESFRRCVAASAGCGLPGPEALGRAQLAVALLNLGDGAAANEEIARARAVAPARQRGAVEMLFGLVLHRTGRLDAALAAYGRALEWLAGGGDDVAMGRARLNRGIILAYQGALRDALEDFAFAERVARARDLPSMAAMAAHNVAFARGRRGDIPGALAAYARAEQAYQALETPHRFLAVLQADRCPVLLVGGLVREARRDAEAALAALAGVDQVHGTECRLLLARALLAEGRYEQAAEQASAAAASFLALDRGPWAAQAGYVGIQADVLRLQDEGAPSPDLLARCQQIAAELELQGWPVEALHVRTFVGRVALALGRPGVAAAELTAAAAARRSGPADQRAQAWHAAALLRLAQGDVAGSKRALLRGVAVVDAYRATLGATELRANAASHGAELARLGVQLALAGGRPSELLRWADRCRASALRTVAVRPPADERLAADLARLRQLRTARREASLSGAGGAEGAGDPGPGPVEAIEEAVRARARAAGHGGPAPPRGLDVQALRQALGDRVLIEYVVCEGRIHAVTVTGRGARHVALGPAAAVAEEKQHLMFALRRLLLGRPGADDLFRIAATRLDDLLVAPVGGAVERAPALVVVPTGLLHGVPWSCLPRLAGRDTTIAPSAALWASPVRPVPPCPRVALVAGPGLPGAEAEVAALARLFPGADALFGEGATAARVLAAMERADLVHVAAHGHFRADSPQFSSLLLADGPLTVYDFERIRRVPLVAVLSACDAAVADVRAGDELLGSAAALLGLGVRSVVAPVFSVPDDATTPLMIAFHEGLVTGLSPSAALARACARPGRATAAAAAFLCVGRDGPSRSPGQPVA